ncbi:DUF551 domain-containing protein [Enterobacter kobei]|uniref:DUF551 domain-containing protein n=1 Tax=Enterobacter kobei TaxID=208224 RepID=UPI0018C24A62|nr:DUF551 domain-containing protein [Enterobacter kobei]MBG0596275.1 DUF551 domain-containing protein [Enterobacter kobei]
MSNINKQAVQAVADLKAGYTLGHADVAILNELARIALASLEAEPVGMFRKGPCGYSPSFHEDAVPLYTVPPAPVSVPDEVTAEDCPAFVKYDITEVDEAWARGFNACRAAMLQGADGSSPVIPDGWVACSDKNPEKGRWLALFGKRTKENCDPYVDEGYLGSDGEFYFFDWESGPRIDDCHPYDKAIVSHWMYWELPAAPKREDL